VDDAPVSEVVVLRLSVDYVREGRLVGWAEAVTSGRQAALRADEDPIAVVVALLTDNAWTELEGASHGIDE
jgi:hypothetical protein